MYSVLTSRTLITGIRARASVLLAAIALLSLSLAGCASATSPNVTASAPTATDVWIKAVGQPTPGMDMTGMFGVFTNDSEEVVYITGGIARDTALTESALDAHEVVADANGVMNMREVAGGIPIPAHGSVELKPGGYHLMVWNLQKPISAGDIVQARITFSNGTHTDVSATARDAANYAG